MNITTGDKRITVLHLCEHFGGRKASLHGVARLFQWWIPAFDASRFRVLLCSRKGYDQAAALMTESGMAFSCLDHGVVDPRNLSRLLRLLRSEKVDIIHAHGYGATTWAHLAGMILRVSVVVHEHCNYGSVPLYQRPVEKFLVGPRTKHAFAVSESSRQFCIQKRHMCSDVVKVLYSGILLENIRKADPAWIQQFRQSRGIGPADRIIGIVGRLESHKGHLDAFRALQLVLKENPKVRLWILGDGAYADTLRAWVNQNGLEKCVDFLGFRKDVLDVVQCFDVQLFPSHMEGTPNTLFEALALGVVSVASTADGQAEVLENDKTALMFTPGDHESMARHLLRVLNDKDLARRLSSNALARSKDFDGHRTIDVMQNLYAQIANGRISKGSN